MGPLDGVRLVELAGIGPGPFAGMMLADMGAEVIRVARPNATEMVGHRYTGRSRTQVSVDLKHPDGVKVVHRLVADADGFFEGMRPGVAERLGLGPDDLLAVNPRLVYGRMTGWGQDGPWAQAAGHDINYIALAGALAAIGRHDQPPTVPLNLVGDFGGGAMYLVTGMLAAIIHARVTGVGQVVDAAMVDGAASLMTMFHDLHDQGLHHLERGTNMLDSGAHFYDVYETADGQWVAIGPIEPQFHAKLVELLDLGDVGHQLDPASWPRCKQAIAKVIGSQPRAHWDDLLGGTDACYSPVLTMEQARDHPHMRAREVFIEVDGRHQPAPAPRFSATPGPPPTPRREDGADTDRVLAELGYDPERVADLRDRGVIG